MKSFKTSDSEIFYAQYGDDKAKPWIIWGHGWGQDHKAFDALIETLKPLANHIALDFPGFGSSPVPQEIWGSENYANAVAGFIQALKEQHPETKIFWAGHSFGGRIALQLGINHSDSLDGLIFIAGAGLKPTYSPLKKLKLWAKVRIFKMFKFLTKLGLSKDWVINNFTEGDYKDAGPMRKIFVKIVNEDLTIEAQQCKHPALLLYGSEDTAAPPEIGQRLHKLMPQSEFFMLDGFDHYSILSAGRHVVAQRIQEFVKRHCEGATHLKQSRT